MSKAHKNDVVKTKTSLWSKFTKWLTSKFTCFGKDMQDEIQDHLDNVGKKILAPIVEEGSNVLENIVTTQVPGIGGQILTGVVESAGDTVVEMLGGATSADTAEA